MISYPALGSFGNLGNQLFQIASTIGIAKANKTDYSLPEWKYEKYFENPLPHGQSVNPCDEKENFFHFDQRLFNLDQAKNYNLISDFALFKYGFLQSEKYWKHAEKEVRDQLKFKLELQQKLKAAFATAFEKPTVAISIRRGDFVNNKSYYQVQIHYYLSAYYKYFKGCNILIFTDDFAYCRLHFEAVSNVYYADNISDIEQLCLMSMCDNFIISNSTFSWWGAYLSGSKNVIRPVKNFDSLAYDEKDYWLPEWKIHDERIDLSDTTFIIPVFYDHRDRKQNIMLTVSFLLKNFNTDIIIGEQGGDSFSFMNDYVDYTRFDMPHFHRTKIINDLIKNADTDIIVNWDCDNICTPAQLLEAVNLIRNGADIAYPFDGRVIRVPRYMFTGVIGSIDVWDINIKDCMPKTFSSVGHAVLMNKKSFTAAGMENENFISWGPEDSERYDRFRILGLKVSRVPGKMYHMDHFIGENSSTRNPNFALNNAEFYKINSMKKDELQNYINTWPWKL